MEIHKIGTNCIDNNANDRLVGVGADIVSPIPQMDGEAEKNKSKGLLYHFVSDYDEEDIVYTLE